MYVAHLSLHDFRSYAAVEVELESGPTAFVGRNGQGKTNLVEAIAYLSRLSSHRVATDAPLVRAGATQAVVQAAVVREGRRAVLEVSINPGSSNKARVNRAPLPRARELAGLVRTVVFAPEDLALVKGDPGERRRFADELQVQSTPRFAGTRADYDRVLRQRTTLLRTASAARRAASRSGGPTGEGTLATLEVWDAHLARLGAEVMASRIRLVEELTPLLGAAYASVARGATRDDARLDYAPSVTVEPGVRDESQLEQVLLAAMAERRREEVERGVSLVGPHRDDLRCSLGEFPVKGYASHGESWSFALGLRLASFELLRAGADDPVLILDDVFAELDAGRRTQLAELVEPAEQVLVTAAVPEDVPETLQGARFAVTQGEVSRET